MKLESSRLYRKRFGIWNSKKEDSVYPEKIQELEDASRELEYGGSSSLRDELVSRIYGGTIRTPHGRRDWTGEEPEDVREFVEQVKNSI